MRLQRGHRSVGRARVDNRHDASLAGDVERVDAQQLAGPADLRAHRDSVLLDHHGHSRSRGYFVEDRGDPTTRGVAHRSNV
jgi:hypothetical protein